MKFLTADEASSSIILMTQRFQECMSKVDKFTSLFNEIDLALKAISAKSNSLDQSQQDLKKSSSDAVAFVHSDLKSQNNEFSISLSKLSDSFDSLSKMVDSLKQETKALKEGLEKSVVNQNNFAQLGSVGIAEAKSDIEDVKTTLLNVMDKWHQKDATNKNAHDYLKNSLNSFSTDLIKTTGTLKEFVGATANFQKDLEAHKGSVASQLEQLKQNLTFQIEDKISALPKPSAIVPISSEDAKILVQKQSESSSLDAKNANLRSSNNEQKITMLEKKVENLQLLLNKLQLSH